MFASFTDHQIATVECGSHLPGSCVEGPMGQQWSTSDYINFHFLCLFPHPQAYSVYDEEIGYCQGQSFLAAVLLLHVSKEVSVLT